jgi:sugar/nucleoside kinase (ribokinase family)
MQNAATDLIAKLRSTERHTSRVLVVGDLNYDIIDLLPQLPEEDKEIFVSSRSRTLAGSAGIFAHALGKLGGKVYLVGRVGDDGGGASLCHELESVGVDTSGVVRVRNGATAETHIYVDENEPGRRWMITLRGVFEGFNLRGLDLTEYPGKVDVLHLCSYFVLPGIQPDILKAIRRAKGFGLKVSFDANSGDGWNDSKTLDIFRRDIFPYVDYLFLNRYEAASVTGQSAPEAMLDALVSYNPTGVLTIKLDAEGSQSQYQGHIIQVDGFPCPHIQDTVGAGDTFDATFIHFHQKGFSVSEAAILANAGARATLEMAGGPTGQRTEFGLAELLADYQIIRSRPANNVERYQVGQKTKQ